MDDAVAESVLIDEREIGARLGRQRGVAPTEDDGPDEQGELIDQPGDERLCCEGRAADQEIPLGGAFQVIDRADVEGAFEPSVGGGRCGEGQRARSPAAASVASGSRDWEMASLVEEAEARYGVQPEGRCFCLKVPAVLGGAYAIENIGTVPLLELIAFVGDLARQIEDLPDGATVDLRIEP